MSRAAAGRRRWGWWTARSRPRSPGTRRPRCSSSPRPGSSRPTPRPTRCAARSSATAATPRCPAATSSATARLIARITAGDAACLDAMLERVADILTRDPRPRPQPRRAPLPGAGLAGPTGRPAAAAARAHRVRRRRTRVPTTEPDVRRTRRPTERPVWAPAHLDRLLGRLAAMSCRQLAALRGEGHRVRPRRRRRPDRTRPGWPGSRAWARCWSSPWPSSWATTTSPCNRSSTSSRQVRVDRLRARRPPSRTHVWLLTGGDVFPFTPRHRDPRRRRLRPRQGLRPRRATGPDRHPQLRAAAPATSPVEDPRRLPLPTGRPRPAPVADPPRALLPASTTPAPTGSTPTAAELILTAPPGIDVYVPDVRLELDRLPAGRRSSPRTGA